ncbi:hypothetical protein CFC21_058987 [Triticum aestivum]|uniref:Probable purine permease n=2 Tax=Triticum aestivum TaxID=4565 RepID=A0A9R1GP54_WHEAT|nr:hypothetical protein CFC21_058987 [Triticum aestivum]
MQEAAKTPIASPPGATAASTDSPARYRPSPLVIFSACLILVGAGGPLLLRVYFVHGGQRLWLSALLQISGWPLLLPPLCVSLFHGRRHGIANLLLPPRLVGAAAVLGGFYAVSCYVYAMGSQALPLSTSSLLLATQLAFTAVFAFLFVGLRFTPFSANAVLLLTIGPAVLRAVLGAAGTMVCLLGMAIKGDFGALRSEAASFGLGKTNYYLVLVWDAVSWQLLNLGIMGLITCASSLLAGIMIAVLLPLSQILAVMFLHEKFDGPKGIALVLSLWGFASYMYGEKVQQKKVEAQKSELLQQQVASKTEDLELAAP